MPTRVAKATDSFNSHWEAHVMTKENNITQWVLMGTTGNILLLTLSKTLGACIFPSKELFHDFSSPPLF